MRLKVSVATAITALVLAGCSSGTPHPVAGAVTAPAPFPLPESVARPNPSAGLIAPADTLSVTVYREPDLSMASVVVSPDGTIQMPLLGNVKVSGYTAEQVSEEIRRGLGARYLVHPEVAVNVVSSPTSNITVEGAVIQPGIYPYVPNTSLIGALAQSRGTSRVARTNEVTVFRNVGADRYLAVFDLDAIRSGRAPDLMLQPGDTVVVGVSGRRQAWQDFLSAAPLLGLFTRI